MKIVIEIPKEHYNEIVYVNYERLRDIVRDGVVIEKCEDAVSRQAVLNIFDEWFATCNIADKRESPKAKINALPSVTPKYTDEEIDKIQAVEQAYVDKMVELAVEEAKRPKGKWIDDCGGVKCSCCGYSIDDDHYAKAYCTNCGAEMSGGGEDG